MASVFYSFYQYTDSLDPSHCTFNYELYGNENDDTLWNGFIAQNVKKQMNILLLLYVKSRLAQLVSLLQFFCQPHKSSYMFWLTHLPLT